MRVNGVDACSPSPKVFCLVLSISELTLYLAQLKLCKWRVVSSSAMFRRCWTSR